MIYMFALLLVVCACCAPVWLLGKLALGILTTLEEERLKRLADAQWRDNLSNMSPEAYQEYLRGIMIQYATPTESK